MDIGSKVQDLFGMVKENWRHKEKKKKLFSILLLLGWKQKEEKQN